MKIEEKLQEIGAKKSNALNHTVDVAKFMLENKSTKAFELIWEAFLDYEKADRQEDSCLARLAKTGYNGLTHSLLNYHNIKDVWYKLTMEEKQLWDGIPELKAWKEQYR